MKRCACCKTDKDFAEFGKKAMNKDGLYNYCRACKAKQDRQYYQLNRSQVLEKVKERADTIKEDLAEYHKEYRERNKDRLSEVLYQSRRSNTGKFLYNACKYRAKERGIDFNLDLDDVIIPKICPILKIPLIVGEGNAIPNSPSIDRIDPSKGYIKGNIQVISYKANTMKSNATEEDLLLFASWIFENFLKDEYEKNNSNLGC